MRVPDQIRAEIHGKDSARYKVANCIQAQPVFSGFARLAHGKVIFVSVLRAQLKPSSAPEPASRAAGDRRRRETGAVLSGNKRTFWPNSSAAWKHDAFRVPHLGSVLPRHTARRRPPAAAEARSPRARRRAGGAPRSTPGGCSGRGRPRARRRAVGDGRSRATGRGGARESIFISPVDVRSTCRRRLRPGPRSG